MLPEKTSAHHKRRLNYRQLLGLAGDKQNQLRNKYQAPQRATTAARARQTFAPEDEQELLSPEERAFFEDIERKGKWFERWWPTIQKLLKIYNVLAEFGVQMAVVLALGFVVIGLLGEPFALLVCTAYAILVVVLAARYIFTLGFVSNILETAGKAYLAAARALGQTLEASPEDFMLSGKQLRFFRFEFLKAASLQAASLLVVLYFTGRIIGGRVDFLGVSIGHVLGESLTNVVGGVVLFGLGLTTASARLFQRLQEADKPG